VRACCYVAGSCFAPSEFKDLSQFAVVSFFQLAYVAAHDVVNATPYRRRHHYHELIDLLLIIIIILLFIMVEGASVMIATEASFDVRRLL